MNKTTKNPSISVEVPQSIIEYCEQNEIKTPKMLKLFAEFVEHRLSDDWGMTGDEFEEWLDANGYDEEEDDE